MEKIKIIFLGTADAIPTKSRNHTSIYINYKNENILIDCGEGTQRQLRLAEINPCKLTKVLITHWHGDHTLGLPGLLQTLHLMNYQKELKIYGPKNTNKNIEIIKQLYGIKLLTSIEEKTSSIVDETEDLLIETKSMLHTSPCNAYSITIKEKRRLDSKKLKKLHLPNSPILKELQMGKTIKYKDKTISSKQVSYLEPAKKITIVLDTELNKNIIDLARNSDILIMESTFLDSEKNQAIEKKHLTAKQSAEIAKKTNSKKLFLTHISQRYKDKTMILKEAQSVFKNSFVAKDLESIIF